ncbi:EAL domain-containing protein [Ornithinibacillus sp. L9]|uniref:EAL domain-containing protein n=1 Tax=Ornithinibacillus caprae TaxID=2678566 RepID=A0A6N8FHY2_9BACI|nr:EAL domain-containing protein [Ornithinibacillus caprae]MUK89043.1 EAL domain-containing protein [Ornithinibacillus caprae]
MDFSENDNLFNDKKFYHAVQPIIRASTKNVFGYEALLRSTDLHNPEEIFEHYKENDLLFHLDMSSIMEACKGLKDIPNRKDSYLFINIFPSTLINPDFLKQLHRLHSINKPSSIVFEINEDGKETNFSEIKHVVGELKHLGYLIALDDVGKGESSFKALLELEPNIVKIDRAYAKNLTETTKKQTMIQLIMQLFGNDVPVILEGIETEDDFLTAKELGVPLMQGYYFGRPNQLQKYI